MKHKVSELDGAVLDRAVAMAEGHAEIEVDQIGGRMVCQVVLPGEDGEHYWTDYHPSTEWEVGGPILERERIHLNPLRCDDEPLMWDGFHPAYRRAMEGPTPLIAAMRAYLASRFGDEIDLP